MTSHCRKLYIDSSVEASSFFPLVIYSCLYESLRDWQAGAYRLHLCALYKFLGSLRIIYLKRLHVIMNVELFCYIDDNIGF